ncbi:GNAT family N-acetyltransferase, partial [Patescibacteria group bacterium]
LLEMEFKKLCRNVIKYCTDIIRLDFIYYDSQPIVYSYGSVYQNCFLGIQTSYIQKYRKLGPGKMIIYLILNDLISKNINIFDFSTGHNAYKAQFTSTIKLQYNAYLSKSFVVNYYWRIVNTARRLRQIFFHNKYDMDHKFLFKKIKS